MIGAPNSAFVRIGNDANAMGSDPSDEGGSVPGDLNPNDFRPFTQEEIGILRDLGVLEQANVLMDTTPIPTDQIIDYYLYEVARFLANSEAVRRGMNPQKQEDPVPPEIVPPSVIQAIDEFIDGFIKGDFSETDSNANSAGRFLSSLFPAGEARDTGAAFKNAIEQKPGSGLQLFAAGIGFIPFFGDGLKQALKSGKGKVQQGIKGFKSFLRESAEQAEKNAAKKGLGNAAKKVDNIVPKSFQAAEQGGRHSGFLQNRLAQSSENLLS